MITCDICRPCDLCARELCELHGEVEPAPTCPAHQECVDCHTDSRCRECRVARREGLA